MLLSCRVLFSSDFYLRTLRQRPAGNNFVKTPHSSSDLGKYCMSLVMKVLLHLSLTDFSSYVSCMLARRKQFFFVLARVSRSIVSRF